MKKFLVENYLHVLDRLEAMEVIDEHIDILECEHMGTDYEENAEKANTEDPKIIFKKEEDKKINEQVSSAILKTREQRLLETKRANIKKTIPRVK
jgi:hypothetical protein